MEDIMTFEEKLIAIQSELKAPKNQRNNFGNYNYRSLEDILEGVKPLLSKYGIALMISDEPVLIGNHIYIKATATLTHASSRIDATAYAREPEQQKGMSPSQLTGTASSYARKYCLNGLFLIDDTKDADTNEYQQQGQPQQYQQPQQQYEQPRQYQGNQYAQQSRGR